MEELWKKFRGLPGWGQALLWVALWPLVGALFFWRSRLPIGKAAAVLVLVAGTAAYAAGSKSTSKPVATPTLSETPSETPSPSPTPTPNVPTTEATVMRIIDGDTLDVRLAEGSRDRIRLIGVDAPERGSAISDRSIAFLERDVPVGDTIYLQFDASHHDRYGRSLAYVWLDHPSDGTQSEVLSAMLNARLLLRGLAVLETVPPNVEYVRVFRQAQSQARVDKVGVWKPKPKPRPAPVPEPSCHPNYSGACLKPNAYDYDCASGSGDGPEYISGPVYTNGGDPYDLDSDGDGVGCES